ncbi:MAG: hypothetical protein K0Q74_819 [Gammaproteobacteria bacterium]|nr:hypothetical protein [Gammaproteobacteria bacterium]
MLDLIVAKLKSFSKPLLLTREEKLVDGTNQMRKGGGNTWQRERNKCLFAKSARKSG